MAATRIRRNDEQLVAELEARIASLKQRAARKQAKVDPAVRHMTAAVRSIDKALDASEDATTRTALQEARGALSACLAMDGVLIPTGTTKRRSQPVDAESLLAHIKQYPGQSGERIAKALGTDAADVRPVMKKLIEAKQVKTAGQRRGMTYQVA